MLARERRDRRETIPTAEEIQRLRRRASQYADADESVIEESRELEERFAYLQRHAEDLRSAADNLQEIMELADNEMRWSAHRCRHPWCK